MADEPGRTPEDIQLARDIAAAAGDLPGWIAPIGITSFTRALEPAKFTELVERVEEAAAGGNDFLSPERRGQLARSFADGLRVLAFYERIGAPFVLALVGMKNAYDASVMIDIFNPRAIEGLGLDPGAWPPPPSDRPQDWPEFRSLVGRLIDQTTVVMRVGRPQASADFATLFVDTLRALARSSGQKTAAASSSTTTTTTFTVHSGAGNMGYQLSVFPQLRYSPVVFGGSTLSTPVSQGLATGHWCFEGRLSGTTASPIRDPGVHFAGPASTSTTTTAF